MYFPKFTISNKILKNIGAIEAAKEIINNAPLIPIWEARFQKEAIVRSVHYGTHLEGNDLSFTQAKKVMEGEKVFARERDIQEVINYRNVLEFLDNLEKKTKEPFLYNEKLLKEIHQLALEKILDKKEAGEFRKTKVVVKEGVSGQVIFTPPPAVEVIYQLDDFFQWLNSLKGRELHPVLRTAIAHFELVRIHPFVDGNGRAARAFANLILFVEGYDIKKLFSLEEHFDKDALSYYQALQSVEKLGDNLTMWLEYFTNCLALELEQVKNKVKKLSLDSRFKDKLGRQIALSERQIKIIEYLKENERLLMSEARKIIPKVSEDTVLRDLKQLMKKGIVRKKGKTKASSYVLAG